MKLPILVVASLVVVLSGCARYSHHGRPNGGLTKGEDPTEAEDELAARKAIRVIGGGEPVKYKDQADNFWSNHGVGGGGESGSGRGGKPSSKKASLLDQVDPEFAKAKRGANRDSHHYKAPAQVATKTDPLAPNSAKTTVTAAKKATHNKRGKNSDIVDIAIEEPRAATPAAPPGPRNPNP